MIDEQAIPWFDSEEDVFGNAEVGGDGKFLINHADSATTSFGWISGCVRFSVDPHFSAVGLVRTGENFHQGAFTRTVFTDEGVDFSSGKFQ